MMFRGMSLGRAFIGEVLIFVGLLLMVAMPTYKLFSTAVQDRQDDAEQEAWIRANCEQRGYLSSSSGATDLAYVCKEVRVYWLEEVNDE